MPHAQISLDFILAIVIALVVLGSIAAVSDAIIEMQSDSTIRQQLNSIGTSLAAIITASAALDELDELDDAGAGGSSISYMISYMIPMLRVPGEERLQSCKIVVSGNKLELSYEPIGAAVGAEETIKETVPFVDTGLNRNPKLTESNPGKCGEEITITS